MNAEVAILGGSFAGLSAALVLARACRKIVVVDAGRPRNRFAAHSHGFLGHDGRTPDAILGDARKQLGNYPTVALLQGEANSARQLDGGFAIELADGRTVEAKRLILATGVRDELPDIPNLSACWGKSVVHCPYCHGYEFRGQPLGALATTAQSIHTATLLPDWGPATCFRHASFHFDEEHRAKLAARGVSMEETAVRTLIADEGKVEAVLLEDGRRVPLTALFVTPRTYLNSPIAEHLGCAIDEGPTGQVIRVDELKKTTVAGVFAAGDASSPMASVTMAAAAGAMAGFAAHQSLMFG